MQIYEARVARKITRRRQYLQKKDWGGQGEEQAWDDVSGEALDPRKVKEARWLEMDYYKKMNVCVKVPIEECRRATGKDPLKTRWIDIGKGERYRSRWVAKQFKSSDLEDWFAATPPIEALRAIISHAVTGGTEKAVMINGVSRDFSTRQFNTIFMWNCAKKP